MHVSPDSLVYWQHGIFQINATILFTWIVIVFVTIGSWLITRRLSTGESIPRWQNLLEIIVAGIRQQLKEVTRKEPDRFMPFVGTLFLFVAISNTLSLIPGFQPPTGSLSTTAALAIAVFIAVPMYSVSEIGLVNYFRNYLQPSFFMLPFNIIGEFSRTLALAVRLFGNVMSGTMIVAILLMLAPVFVPILIQLLGLLTGLVQAYIFAILAAVYIGAGMQIQNKTQK